MKKSLKPGAAAEGGGDDGDGDDDEEEVEGEGLRDPASKKFKGRRLLVDLVGAKRLQVQAERRDFLRENVELLRGQW